MIRFLIILLLLIPVSAFPFQNEPTGFKNISWDSTIGSSAGLRAVGQSEGTVQRFMKMDEIFSFEGLTLSDIRYVTDQGKFVRAEITYDCAQQGTMAKVLKNKYGAATSEKGAAMTWHGKVTTITLGPPVAAKSITPAPNAEPTLCSLTYSSTAYHLKSVPQQQGR